MPDNALPARLSLVTLGVTDLARSTAFYQALGWPLSSSSSDEVSFFRTAGGLLGLFPADELAADAQLPVAPLAEGFRGVTLAVNVEGRAEVDAAYAAALAAGGTGLKEPVEMSWGGYHCYFADPDGHPWEVAHNPGWPIGVDGLPILP